MEILIGIAIGSILGIVLGVVVTILKFSKPTETSDNFDISKHEYLNKPWVWKKSDDNTISYQPTTAPIVPVEVSTADNIIVAIEPAQPELIPTENIKDDSTSDKRKRISKSKSSSSSKSKSKKLIK
jgi:hypothetical protein